MRELIVYICNIAIYSYTMVTNFGISVIYIPRKVRTTQSKNPYFGAQSKDCAQKFWE